MSQLSRAFARFLAFGGAVVAVGFIIENVVNGMDAWPVGIAVAVMGIGAMMGWWNQ